MAHNRKINFERFYCRMSIGQLLLLDENLLDYIKLTAPFGSGDGKTDAQGNPLPSAQPVRAPTKEGAERLAKAIARGWGTNAARMRDVGKLDRSKLDEQLGPQRAHRLRILIGDLEKG